MASPSFLQSVCHSSCRSRCTARRRCRPQRPQQARSLVSSVSTGQAGFTEKNRITDDDSGGFLLLAIRGGLERSFPSSLSEVPLSGTSSVFFFPPSTSGRGRYDERAPTGNILGPSIILMSAHLVILELIRCKRRRCSAPSAPVCLDPARLPLVLLVCLLLSAH